MRVIGIDPGLRACGVATYGSYWDVFTIRPKGRDLLLRIDQIIEELPLRGGSEDLVVIEKPQIYQGRKQKGDPNDLIDLAVLVGSVAEHFGTWGVFLPTPQQWKRQVPKEIHHKRIRAKVPELGRVSKDALDAVGLALWGMEKLNARSTKR